MDLEQGNQTFGKLKDGLRKEGNMTSGGSRRGWKRWGIEISPGF